MKFLHIADVHLGCTRYQLPESPRDFFDAWIDVIKRYAIDEKVDFVIMCGDFFHKKSVPPETMNYAFAGLSLLKDAGIPVVAIEGNHDARFHDSDYSWLRSLSNWNLVYLIEPTNTDGVFRYEPWNDNEKRGGFIDIGRARIFGSQWFGSSSNTAIPMLTEAIKENRREVAFHILMLHTDVEGHQTHPIPALSLSSLKELRSVTDYVGLGHTHKHYEIDNWAFNPGSIEVTNVAEFKETRGVFIVEVDDDSNINARHIEDYRYRPFQRLPFDVSSFDDTKKITEAILDMIRRKANVTEKDKPAPIIEITLKGRLGFPNSLLEQQLIRETVKEMTGALHVRLKNQTVPVEFAVAADIDDDAGREKLERRVIEDLVQRDARFKSRFESFSEAVVGAKRLALSDESPEMIADFIAERSLKEGETLS